MRTLQNHATIQCWTYETISVINTSPFERENCKSPQKVYHTLYKEMDLCIKISEWLEGTLIFSTWTTSLDYHVTEQIMTRLVWPSKKECSHQTTMKSLLSLGPSFSLSLGKHPSQKVVSLSTILYGWLLRKLQDFSYCDEFSFEPAVIFQSFINTNFLSLQFHLSMVDIWILGWGMVSPDNDILYILRSHTKFKSNLVI